MRGVTRIRRCNMMAFTHLPGICSAQYELNSPAETASNPSLFCREIAMSLPSSGSLLSFTSSSCAYSNYAFGNTHPTRREHMTAPSKSGSDVHDSEREDSDDDEEVEHDDDSDESNLQNSMDDKFLACNVKKIVGILDQSKHTLPEIKNMVEQCGVAASSELVVEVLSRVRNNWEAAFTYFLWAGKQQGYAYSAREYHSMISILAKMRKFDTAWTLIDEMRRGRDGPSLVTSQTLLIMIRRYCAVHDVGRAINTFYAHKQYGLEVGIDEFHGLLSALCRYKNVKDAEHLLFCNRNVFPLNTKSFNIILNGWCNVIISPRQGERIWREMSRRGVAHDVISYASIMSSYSKTNNFNKVLKLFDHMEQMGISPDRKVYNAVIHVLAKRNFVRKARVLMKSMEEKGIVPGPATYNSLIKPLCKDRKVDEAKEVFDEMLQRGIRPTFRTFNAFLRILKTGEAVFELLETMKKLGCPPNYDTYIMLIRKFCRWRQLDDVSKLWSEMNENGMSPDRSSYIVLIHGLFLNGKLEEAYKYYQEMKKKGFTPEPKTDEMLQAWISGKEVVEWRPREDQSDDCQVGKIVPKKSHQERDFLQQPETRKVVREQGYSFWVQ